MVWYRLRVSESQRHTPTQKFSEYPLPPPLPGLVVSVIMIDNSEKRNLISSELNVIELQFTCKATSLL